MAKPSSGLPENAKAMRQCPTLSGDQRPLITHSIESCLCMQRQREFYHKCHRCVFRGKAADFVLPEGAADRTEAVPALVIETSRETDATPAPAGSNGSYE